MRRINEIEGIRNTTKEKQNKGSNFIVEMRTAYLDKANVQKPLNERIYFTTQKILHQLWTTNGPFQYKREQNFPPANSDQYTDKKNPII